MNIVDNFLKYVSFETTSDENNISETKASSQGQYLLAEELKKDLLALGAEEVYINSFGTVHGYFKGDIDKEPICLLAHMDTSPAALGKDIKPRIVKHYDGKDIVLSEGNVMKVEDFPSLKESIDHDLIVTDGTTLLGGDDKAGIAIIMDIVTYYVNSKKSHSPIEVVFSSDEEIGVGADHIDVEKLHSKFGYTVDGGDIKYLSIENFNAASMELEINGRSIHPGSAKNKMINAINVGIKFHNALPFYQRPEHTQNREGFYHLMNIQGNEEKAHLDYIVREHDINKLHAMLDVARLTASCINEELKSEVITLKIKETYKNMISEVNKHPEVLKLITDIYDKFELPYELEPIRGGTDGASLTFKGFVCPNLGTGDYNCHGRFEYVDIDQMQLMAIMLRELFC